MALFLTPEEMFDRPLGGEDRANEIPHWAGNILYVVVAFLCKIVGRYRVEGRENLRALKGKSGALVASTHTSFLDVAFLYVAVRPTQWVRLMARDTLFKHPLGAQIIARVGGFPVVRDSADRTSVKRAVRMLKNKEVVGIFPEGTRRGKSGTAPKLHAGAALVARMGGAPLVPAAVVNAENIKVKGDWRIHFPKVYVRFGQPIEVSSFDFLPKEDRLDGCIWYVMRESFALARQVPANEIDMVELFPDAKDFTQAFAEHPVVNEES